MGTLIKTGTDVITFLEGQHQDIQRALRDVTDTRGEGRSKAFFELRRIVAVHETAEEVIVHPVARRVLPSGEAIVQTRRNEERESKAALAEVAKLERNSREFDAKFDALRTALLAHADAEEREEFAKIREKLDARQLEWMRRAVQLAERVVFAAPVAEAWGRIML